MTRWEQMMLMMMVVMQARDMSHHFQAHTHTHPLGHWGMCVCAFCFFPSTFPTHHHPTNFMTTLKKLVGQISGAEDSWSGGPPH